MNKLLRRIVHSSYSPLPAHEPIYLNDIVPKAEKSKLPNGIKIVTEVSPFPNSVNIGILFGVGSRHDPKGFLDAYKETFLKSTLKSDQKHYSVLDEAGCDISLVFDRETLYINTTCLEEHLDHIVPALKHSIFHQKTEKDLKFAAQRFNHNLTPLALEKEQDSLLFQSAYSEKSLGILNPRASPIEISKDALSSFISDYLTSDRLTVAAVGVKNHQKFADLIHQTFGDIPKSTNSINEKSIYTGGDYRRTIDNFMSYVTVGFEGFDFNSRYLHASAVLKTIIGEGGGFSTGGPGKGMNSRSYKNILPYGFIESVKAVNHNFTDSGVFGVSIVGLESYIEYAPDLVIKELVDILKATPEEIERAKKIITRESLINYQKSLSRLEDYTKTCHYYYKTPDELGYLDKINLVTLQDIQYVLTKLLKSIYTLNILSKNTKKVPTREYLYKKIGRP